MKRETPLRAALREPIDAASMRRMWVGIDRRWNSGRMRRPGLPLLAIAVAAMLGAVALSSSWLIAARTSRAHGAATVLLAPLALDNGEPVTKLAAPEHRPAVVHFNEGSHLEMQARAALEPLSNAPDAVTWLLSQGRVTFDVKPGGARRWSIECGVATVDVVGTRFTLDRVGHGLTVQVEHGVVLVRGERVPDRVQRLAAGDELAIPDDQEGSSARMWADRIESQRDSGVPSRAPGAPRGPATERSSVASPAAMTSPSRADGGPEDAAVDELLARSDQARAAGRFAAAASILSELIRVHPSDARAPTAAFTLGKIRLDGLADASGAASAFHTALQLGLDGELREDAYVRLVEARSCAGDEAGARAAAEAYDARYPGGSRHAAIVRWLSSR